MQNSVRTYVCSLSGLMLWFATAIGQELRESALIGTWSGHARIVMGTDQVQRPLSITFGPDHALAFIGGERHAGQYAVRQNSLTFSLPDLDLQPIRVTIEAPSADQIHGEYTFSFDSSDVKTSFDLARSSASATLPATTNNPDIAGCAALSLSPEISVLFGVYDLPCPVSGTSLATSPDRVIALFENISQSMLGVSSKMRIAHGRLEIDSDSSAGLVEQAVAPLVNPPDAVRRVSFILSRSGGGGQPSLASVDIRELKPEYLTNGLADLGKLFEKLVAITEGMGIRITRVSDLEARTVTGNKLKGDDQGIIYETVSLRFLSTPSRRPNAVDLEVTSKLSLRAARTDPKPMDLAPECSGAVETQFHVTCSDHKIVDAFNLAVQKSPFAK